jgi:carbon monoxide dehydrogenase subunit G
MKIEGTFNIAAGRPEVWRLITDPSVMGSCIPGCNSIEVTGDNSYQANIEVKVGPIKAKFGVDVEVTEEVILDHIISTTRGEEGGRASVISAHNLLKLSDSVNGGTEVYYSSDVTISGRLGKYGHGIMKKVAKNLSDKFVDDFRNQVETNQAV